MPLIAPFILRNCYTCRDRKISWWSTYTSHISFETNACINSCFGCPISIVVRKHISSYRTSFIATITINILYIPNKQSTLTRYFADVSHFHIFVENRLCSKQTIWYLISLGYLCTTGQQAKKGWKNVFRPEKKPHEVYTRIASRISSFKDFVIFNNKD